jgi:hypothetical protein
MTNSEELLNKKLTDVAKSNSSGDMWFIKAPSWEGWKLGDEENSGNFSYWHLYNPDFDHKGTISVEDGIITQLPRDLMERKMTNEQLRMQMLSGIITEGEYKAKLEEKSSLNESMIGGIVGVGAIAQIPPRAKADYEMAFEHFLGERYDVEKTDNPNQDLEEDDNAKRKDDLVKLIATGERQLADLKQMKDKISSSSIAKAEKAIDMLKDALEGTNEGKEVEEPENY